MKIAYLMKVYFYQINKKTKLHVNFLIKYLMKNYVNKFLKRRLCDIWILMVYETARHILLYYYYFLIHIFLVSVFLVLFFWLNWHSATTTTHEKKWINKEKNRLSKSTLEKFNEKKFFFLKLINLLQRLKRYLCCIFFIVRFNIYCCCTLLSTKNLKSNVLVNILYILF